jgi:serine protease AprX
MMRKTVWLLFLIFIGISAFPQIAPNKYFIRFTDKNHSPYSLKKPEEFLTARALARRAKYKIPIRENDIPVNPQYVDSLVQTGVKILNTSRWLNGVTVYTTDTALIDSIRRFSFVKSALKFAPVPRQVNKFEKEALLPAPVPAVMKKAADSVENSYGAALTQIKQINGIYLHRKGFCGKGMVIAVLDAGYSYVPVQPLFKKLREEHRILGTRDFVNPGGSVYPPHYHGRMVLSCMAADLPGTMIGTAPEASYWLLRSEDAPTENVIEEYNWVSAAEFADSVGADIINSSLGYIDFDDSTFSHPYSDMDGHTCISTLGAEIAAYKGMLVVNSAGNNGDNSSFPWIVAPADGDSVLTVGAVNSSGKRAFFSSVGPTYDGRIKPTLMAMGQGNAVANSGDSVTRGSGTSFSSPVLAGMCACLWQAHPQATNMQILEALKKTASLANRPDTLMGWGIPDFAKADTALNLMLSVGPLHTATHALRVFPNPFYDYFYVSLDEKISGYIRLSLWSLDGKRIFSGKYWSVRDRLKVNAAFLQRLTPGVYLLQMTSGGKNYHARLVKQ